MAMTLPLKLKVLGRQGPKARNNEMTNSEWNFDLNEI